MWLFIRYPGASVIMICFDLNSKQSLENVGKKWIPEINQYCDNKDVPVMLVGTKKDLQDNFDNELVQATINATNRVNRNDYFECSAKSLDNLDKVVQHAAVLAFNYQKHEKKASNEAADNSNRRNSRRCCIL